MRLVTGAVTKVPEQVGLMTQVEAVTQSFCESFECNEEVKYIQETKQQNTLFEAVKENVMNHKKRNEDQRRKAE
ncbi:hypothetical protein M406DRAFT_101743 [Cryphonectria parasitica EP155]|uniref:Uncharacterized protein n=1 Tax=Cryphonectria parasitica (strain ATCC 38755 / EP155) TaxID=660469 RepID=A0A9P4Y414_CRYP1|nr:uncharacterized protein M406DRAFT_101743 [Cryphonectria parasitica EP155]KAF3766554.1 hypothetical protein M406DRAFT_101743 [Cryphonectria parasitica EP155]